MIQLPGMSATLAEKREHQYGGKKGGQEKHREPQGGGRKKGSGMEMHEQMLASREEIWCMEPYSCWKKSLCCMPLWG